MVVIGEFSCVLLCIFQGSYGQMGFAFFGIDKTNFDNCIRHQIKVLLQIFMQCNN